MDRRTFFQFAGNAALGVGFGVGSAPIWLGRAMGAGEGRKKTLVAIFQRGAADGLNIVVPYGDKSYYQLRPNLNIAPKDVVKLDNMFGFHPQMASLEPIFREKRLAIVQAVGSPDPTRSHFDAQAYMEAGTPGRKSTDSGWLNRALLNQANSSPTRGVSMGTQMALSMKGPTPALSISELGKFAVAESRGGATFESLYSGTADGEMRDAGKETFDAMRILQSIAKQPYRPTAGVTYPASRFGKNLQQIAQLIKANVGVEVAFADIGGWDHHVNELPQLTNLLRDYSRSLAAFYKDLEDRMDDVVIVTMSEFGRTARENGTRGTDHGHANHMLVMGGPIKGGKVYGDWPGLNVEALHEGRDLAMTTDFRDVLGEVVSKHLQNRQLDKVFPGYRGTKRLQIL
jgi:uncharacterized protein (DUF1501 family)